MAQIPKQPPSLPSSSPSVERQPRLRRVPSWPTTVCVVSDGTVAHQPVQRPLSTARSTKAPLNDPFEDDLDCHPEDHFLSPIMAYEYEDWADDSEDDGEEIEWDAGITDFALFDEDRRHAQETGDALPSKWDGMLSSQAASLHRAVERTKSEPNPGLKSSSSDEDVPGLTPDHSPNLRDDLDLDTPAEQSGAARPPSLSITVTPPDEDNYRDDDEAVDSGEETDLPLSFYVQRAKERRRAARKLERPGLRHSRTMSGKVHTWRRPSWHIYPVGEDPEAERRAEMGAVRRVEQTASDDERVDRRWRLD